MVTAPTSKETTWGEDDRLRSILYDDLYCSKEGGDDETRHVFIAGNNLPERWKSLQKNDTFTIAELGFGTGLNFLTTVDAWCAQNPQGKLHYISYELHPLSAEDAVKHLEKHASLKKHIPEFTKSYKILLNDGFKNSITFNGVTLQVIFANALTHLPTANFMADAWYLDGFAPTKNPDLWDEKLIHALSAHTNPQGTFATYSAARHVRDKLEGAGFTVSKQKGFGKKRDMLTGILNI